MTSVPELVALLYRADWMQLSLSARVTRQRDREIDRQLRRSAETKYQQRGRAAGKLAGLPDADEPRHGQLDSECYVLLAPGGRYRVQEAAGAAATGICDGESHWTIIAGAARRRPADGPDHALRGLLTPRWLLACYDLQITGSTDVSDRVAHQVAASPRLVTARSTVGDYHLLDRVDVLVDARLGIILRSEQVFAGQTLELAEMHDLVIDPPQAADPAMFVLPPGMPAEDDQGLGTFEPHGPGWQAATAAAGLAASAMGFAVRHAPRRAPRRTPGDAEAAMPPDAQFGPVASPGREPVSDELVNLLHRTGLPAQAFTAELHQWADQEAFFDVMQAHRHALPQWLDGILGPDALWDALGEPGREDGSQHKTAWLRVAVPGRYRIDYLTGDWRTRCKAVACDGEHTRRIFDDRVAVGPARPLRNEHASLIDPAWLLRRWSLSSAGPASVAGQPGLRVIAEPTGGTVWSGGFSAVEVIVDAELGVLLRQTSYVGGRPAARSELRNLTPHDGGAGSDGPGGFGADAAAGLRVVADSEGVLSDRDLPAPVQAAGTAAALAVGGAIAGAVAVTGWLDKHRARRGTGTRE